MTSSDDSDSKTVRHRGGGQADQCMPQFREHRLLFGDRRAEASQRLGAEMAETWHQASEPVSDGGVHRRRAVELLKRADDELRHRRRETAWPLAQAARRELIYTVGEDERQALAASVREETEKLSDWRRRAVQGLVPDDGRVPNAAALVEAFRHIDTQGSNQARSARVLRRELLLLAAILLVTAGLLIYLLAAWLPGGGVSSSALSALASVRLAVLAALFGVLGACFSSMQRATRRRGMRVPELRAATWAGLLRPLVGAGAGLVVWALAVEGLLGNQGLLGLAFASGFSERVILRFLPDIPESSGEADEARSPHSPREGPKGTVVHPTTFRANVGLAVLNQDGKVLLLRRADHPEAWQLPQGGLEPGETPTAASWRELGEETGLSAADVELGSTMDYWLGYELPEQLRSAKTGRGQVQLWHAFRLTRTDVQIKPGSEFTDYRWVDWDEAIAGAVPFRQPIYRQVRDFVRRVIAINPDH